MRWSEEQNNPLVASLHDDSEGGYILDIADAGLYQVLPDKGVIRIPLDAQEPRREMRLLGLPLLLCFLERGDLSLHAAAIEGPEGAILIAAPGRHGKTSLAAAFVKLGYRLLTEDLCCIRPGPTPMLLPGPASLRVRPDMAPHLLPIPGMKEIGTLDDRLVLAATDPGGCDAVPISAIILLKDFGDQLVVEPSRHVESLPDFWLLSLHLPSERDRARKFEQLVDFLNRVPIWNVVQTASRTSILETASNLLSRIAAGR